MSFRNFAFYPLQMPSMWKDPSSSSNELLIFGVFVVVIIAVIVVFNLARRGAGGTKAAGGSGGVKLFSGFAMHKLAREIGLNHEQIKMLDFVFKTDEVADYEKSMSTPALLDRHFRRAYRVIEQTSGNDAEIQHRHFILFSTRNLLESSGVGTISSTRQIKEETVLTLTHGKEKINVAVMTPKTDQLTVEMPKNVLGTQIKIPKGTRVSVLFFTKSNKGFAFETRVTGYSTMHGHPTLQLAHSNQLRFLSQRRYRRKQAVIACFMYLVYVEGSGRKQRMVVDKRRLTGNIADISVGGCSIKTNSPIQVGARFKIEFTQGENSVAALGQVLRTNRTGVNTIIHVKFIKASQRSMNIINAFVYEYGHE